MNVKVIDAYQIQPSDSIHERIRLKCKILDPKTEVEIDWDGKYPIDRVADRIVNDYMHSSYSILRILNNLEQVIESGVSPQMNAFMYMDILKQCRELIRDAHQLVLPEPRTQPKVVNPELLAGDYLQVGRNYNIAATKKVHLARSFASMDPHYNTHFDPIRGQTKF